MNTIKIKILLIAACFSFLRTASLYAAAEVPCAFEITGRLDIAELNSSINWTRDKDCTADYRQILSGEYNFTPHIESRPLILNYTEDAIWVKIDIRNNSENEIEWILEYRYPLIDEIEFYEMTPSGLKVLFGGDSRPGRERYAKARTFAFPVTSPAGMSTLMLRIRSQGSMNINLQAWNPGRFREFLRDDQLFQGIFIGIMLALLVYNLFIYIYMRHTSYIYLVLYIIAVTTQSLSNNGFGPVNLWPDSVSFTQWAHPFTIFATIAAIILFGASFLNLRHHMPRINRLSYIFAAAAALVMPLTIVAPYRIMTQMSVAAAILTATYLITVSLITLRTGRRDSIYFISSYLFFAVGVILLAARAYGATRETYYEVWGMQTGATLMVLLLSLGIADKIRAYRDDKEKALMAKQETESRFRVLFDNAHDSIIIQQHDQVVYANNALQKLTGYNSESLKGISPESILKRTLPAQQYETAPSYQYSARLLTESGEMIDVIVSVAGAQIGGEPARIFIITDVSSLKAAEDTIRRQYEEIESQYEEMAALNSVLNNNHIEILEANDKLGREKEQLAATIKSITEAVITIDRERRIVLVNPETERLLGMQHGEITGREFSDILSFTYYTGGEPFPDPARTLLEKRKTITAECPLLFTSRHGQEFILELTGNPVITGEDQISGGVIILHDITDKYRLEQDILRIRKIDSLSVLAGGIAHDFNNLLTAILGNISIAKQGDSSVEECMDYLDRIEQSTIKATGLTQQLLTFSKGGDPVKRPESVRQLLQQDMEFMLTGSKVKGTLEIADDLLNAEVDINQFSQVVQNLILNALQAMPDGGNIRITAENLVNIKSLPMRPGLYIKIMISDEGVGIPAGNLDKIFDPYFTTKETGSGLGLASCYSIIKRHGGYIEVSSEQDKGSTFKIYLPATSQASSDGSRSSTIRDFGGRSVLLLDDDQSIREVVGRILATLNLRVTSCATGNDAVGLFAGRAAEGKPFDLFITDLVIPGSAGGEAVLKKIRNIDPSVLSIAISGYSTDPIMSNYRDYGFSACLGKPFDIRSMAAVIADVLKVK